MECESCGAEMPGDSKAEVIAAWNKRPNAGIKAAGRWASRALNVELEGWLRMLRSTGKRG